MANKIKCSHILVEKQSQALEILSRIKAGEKFGKLAKELSKSSTGHTLYILDEPTTGLHFHDVQLLLRVLEKLRNNGNTVVVIEHNMEVIKCSDWIIDLGPEGGSGGGEIVAEGSPEHVARSKTSYTGKYLKEILKTKKSQSIKRAIN